ncbi:hypothetical protein SCHAM137S_01988 [Streptomyces chartreusis]|nr:hypothetical protein SAMN05216482_0031 [Streptomyces sp. PAN_FS17]
MHDVVVEWAWFDPSNPFSPSRNQRHVVFSPVDGSWMSSRNLPPQRLVTAGVSDA